MSAYVRHSLAVSLAVFLHFLTGCLFLRNAGSSSVFGSIIAAVCAAALSFVLFCSVSTRFFVNLRNRLVIRHGNAGLLIIRFAAGVLLFLYLSVWWFAAAVRTWEYAVFSVQSLIMAVLAAGTALAAGMPISGSSPGAGSPSRPFPGDPAQKRRIDRKFTALFIFTAFLCVRILAGFTNNTGFTPAYRAPYVEDADTAGAGMVVIALDNISLNRVINFAVNNRLPHFSQVIGESAVGALPSGSRDDRDQFWAALFTGGAYGGNRRMNVSRMPADIDNIDRLNHFGITDFFLSLLFKTRNETKSALFDIRSSAEPLYDTAERFHLSTGIVNFPCSQKMTVHGFSVPAACFSPEAMNDTQPVHAFPAPYPPSIQPAIDSLRHAAPVLPEYEKLVENGGEHVGKFLMKADRIAAIGRFLVHERAPRVLLIRLDADITQESTEAGSDTLLYGVFDSFLGYCRQSMRSLYPHFIVIGQSCNPHEDSFIMYAGPQIQDTEKMVSPVFSRTLSDMLYLLRIPLLKQASSPIDSGLFRRAYLAAHPPKYAPFYPPLSWTMSR